MQTGRYYPIYSNYAAAIRNVVCKELTTHYFPVTGTRFVKGSSDVFLRGLNVVTLVIANEAKENFPERREVYLAESSGRKIHIGCVPKNLAYWFADLRGGESVALCKVRVQQVSLPDYHSVRLTLVEE